MQKLTFANFPRATHFVEHEVEVRSQVHESKEKQECPPHLNPYGPMGRAS